MWDPTALVDGKRINAPEISRAFQQHVVGGVLWALGLAEGESAPQAVKLD